MSRNEQALQAIIDGDDSSKLEPAQSRNERILHAIIDDEDLSKLPAPQSPIESLLIQVGEKIQQGGGASAEPLSVTENGEYTAPSGKAYTPVTVAVQPSLSALSVTENGTYTPSGFDGYSQVTVDVQGGGGDHDVEDGIIQRTISGMYTNSRVASVGTAAFYNCDKMTEVNLPNATYIGSSAFFGCADIGTASFPNVTTVRSSAFYGCNELSTVYFYKLGNIYDGAFTRCFNLLSLYLLGSSKASLSTSKVFNSSPIAGYTTSTGGVYGSIYVPASLVSSYQTATNWTYFSERFVSLTSAEIAALEG